MNSDYIRPEDNLGKVYDSRLIRRIWKYTRPYLRYFTIAFIMAIILAGSEILLPYLTKIGIDDYILIKNKRVDLTSFESDKQEQIIARHEGKILRINEAEFIIREAQLDPKDKFLLMQSDAIDSGNYYRVEIDRYSAADRRKVIGLTERHPDYFIPTLKSNILLISDENLLNLPQDERAVLRRADWIGIGKLSIFYLCLLLGSVGIMYFQVCLMAWLGQKIMFDIRTELFDHIQRLPLGFFSAQPTGRLVTRVSNDVDALNEMFTSIIIEVFKNILMLIGIIIAMLMLSPRLASLTMMLLPIVIVITIIFKRRMRDAYRDVRTKLAVINATLSEHISGIKLIQAFARQIHHFNKFKKINDESYRANMHQLIVQSSFSPFMVFMENLGIAVILYYGGGQVVQNNITLGTLVAFLSYLTMFFGPVRDIAEKFNILQSAMAASERIFQLIDKKQENADDDKVKVSTPLPGKLNGDIEFQNVWFAYEDEDWVLQDVSFVIRSGETAAFVGATGSGKSTIINLLTRFYSPQKGTILIDGMDIRQFDRRVLRSHMAIVLQDVFLFAGDIIRNIRLNQDDISVDQVMKSARLVHADTFITRFPDKYQHLIEEGGTTLSQGQRQLLAFARALAFNPSILILDEATANIDSETEILIQNALDKLLSTRTSVVVAHRLSTIKKADRIIVMHRGRIMEVGNHRNLLEQQGIYYRLYQLQYQHQETYN